MSALSPASPNCAAHVGRVGEDVARDPRPESASEVRWWMRTAIESTTTEETGRGFDGLSVEAAVIHWLGGPHWVCLSTVSCETRHYGAIYRDRLALFTNGRAFVAAAILEEEMSAQGRPSHLDDMNGLSRANTILANMASNLMVADTLPRLVAAVVAMTPVGELRRRHQCLFLAMIRDLARSHGDTTTEQVIENEYFLLALGR